MSLIITKEFVNECRSIGYLKHVACQAVEQLESKDKQIAELKTKLENVQASAYAESVDAGMRERKLKCALWLARAAALNRIDVGEYKEEN